VLAGVHPGAAGQPTEIGRTLATLVAWDGRLYGGYGDINANAGPIAVISFDPRKGAFAREWASDTEAIFTYRPIAGRLFAPATDPRAAADYAVGPPWKDERPIGCTHAYDMATLTGDDLWLVGSAGVDAVAWRSLDAGRSWRESLRVTPAGEPGEDYSRFHFAGVLGRSLYVQASDYHHGPKPASSVFDGRRWSSGPNLLPAPAVRGWHAVGFANRLVYQSDQTVAAGVSQLLAFDGRRVSLPLAEAIHDFTTDRGSLLALTTQGEVLRTRDLARWQRVATAPPGSRSIGALGGAIYVGTTDSRLYRSRPGIS
jgi:hypothetical protein